MYRCHSTSQSIPTLEVNTQTLGLMTSLTCVQVSQYITWSIPTHEVDTQTLFVVIDDIINLGTHVTVHRTVHTYP